MVRIVILVLVLMILFSGCSYVDKYNAVVQPPKNITPVVNVSEVEVQTCKVVLDNGTEQVKYGDDCNIVIKIG